jgi:hypothetical protein
MKLRWITKAREEKARALLARQENPQARKPLSPNERDQLKALFFAVDQQQAEARTRLEKARGGSTAARRLEGNLAELIPLWERLRTVVEEDEPALGYMQGKGAT